MKNFDPEGAADLAKLSAADKSSAVEDEIDHLLNPIETRATLHPLLALQGSGKHDEARKIYRDANALAPVLPPLN